MRAKLWLTAEPAGQPAGAGGDKNDADDEVNYYDISHYWNICPHHPGFPLSMCSLYRFPRIAQQKTSCQPFDVFMIIILIK